MKSAEIHLRLLHDWPHERSITMDSFSVASPRVGELITSRESLQRFQIRYC